jgi:hypothetical protein
MDSIPSRQTASFTMDEQTKAQHLAKTIIADLQSLLAGPLPADADASAIASELRGNVDRVTCFSDLHDYMDANTLGESEEVWEELTADIPPEGDERKVQAACDVVNDAQSMVNEWIRQGGLKSGLEKSAPSDAATSG